MQQHDLRGNYRKDIDGLRAIAVLAVILFHFGYLRYGYLGVDVFFVISGYLITGNIYNDTTNGIFSLSGFYIRRVRRIMPLVLLINSIALAIGFFVMLPNDLENLSESVIATNFFSNNILQYLTVGNYWAATTKFMPLMHTWSLGVEEQFYLIYPLVFILLKKRAQWLLPVLGFITVLSLAMYAASGNHLASFYFLTTRFFEISFGGLAAIAFCNRYIITNFRPLLIALLIALLVITFNIPTALRLFLVVLVSAGIIVSKDKSRFWVPLLQNNVIVYIGKISFSLYMWHQVVLAFTRYFILDAYTYLQAVCMSFIIAGLSVLTYVFIEQPFRNKNKMSNRAVLLITSVVFILLTSFSFYIYSRAGVVRDVPELGITQNNHNINMHAAYNDRIYKYDRAFSANNKIKVLILGHSFARDWANVLLESKFKDDIEISYIFYSGKFENETKEHLAEGRVALADYIFITPMDRDEFNTLFSGNSVGRKIVRVIGVKNFGSNNGIFYNKKKNKFYCYQRTFISQQFINKNEQLRKEWGACYIDFIKIASDRNGAMPVFTPDCKFISQDCIHLTPYGAAYFAKLFEDSHALELTK
jgi:peptidoglycan/LPS O-acetylase OafA/YrhL